MKIAAKFGKRVRIDFLQFILAPPVDHFKPAANCSGQRIPLHAAGIQDFFEPNLNSAVIF